MKFISMIIHYIRSKYSWFYLLFGAIFAFSYSSHFLNIWQLNYTEIVFYLLYLVIFFTLLIITVGHKANQKFRQFRLLARVFLIVISVIVGFFITFAWVKPLPPSTHTLEIIASGEKNLAAQGSEVWVNQAIMDTGQIISLENFNFSGQWRIISGVPVASGEIGKPAVLSWAGVVRSIRLVLTSHQWSGIVVIRWDSIEQKIDLYADPSKQIEVNLPERKIGQGGIGWNLVAIGLYISDSLSIGLVIILCILFILWTINKVIFLVYRRNQKSQEVVLVNLNKFVISSLGMGLFVSISLLILFFDYWNWSLLAQLGFVVLGTITLGALFSLMMLIFVRSGWDLTSHKNKLYLILASLLLGGFLIVVLPIEIPIPPATHTLEIVATGQRNPEAKGSEVWLFALQKDNGSQIDLRDFQLDSGWEFKDGALVSTHNQPASAKWVGKTDQGLNLILLNHPWSGKIELNWDQKKQDLDLFSLGSKQNSISLSGATKNNTAFFLSLLIVYFGLVGIVFIILASLIFRPFKEIVPGFKSGKLAWLFFAIPLFCVSLIYLITFWPGLLSPDSIDQWNQASTGPIYSDYRMFYTFLLHLSLFIYKSPTTFIFFQILLSSIVFGYVLWFFWNKGTPLFFVLVALALVCLSPMVSTLSVTLWPDIPYSISVLFLTIILINIGLDQASFFKGPKWIILALTCTFVGLLRVNGLLITIMTLLGLFIFIDKTFRKKIVYTLLVTGLMLFCAQTLLPKLIGVAKSNSTNLLSFIMVHQIGAHTVNGTPLSSDEKIFLKNIRPEDTWPYNCYDGSSIFWDNKINYSFINENYDNLIHVYITLLLRAPLVNIQHIICSSTLVWKVGYPTSIFQTGAVYFDNQYFYTYEVDSYKYTSHLSAFPELFRILRDWISTTKQPDILWLFWSSGFWLYLSIGSVLIFIIRQNKKVMLLCLSPIIANSISIALFTQSQEYRYQYSVILCGMVLWLLIPLSKFRLKKIINNSDEEKTLSL